MFEDQEAPRGAEVKDAEEESCHSNFLQERCKYVTAVERTACRLTYVIHSVANNGIPELDSREDA